MNNVQRDNPLVSICCVTYNHEKYIREAIEGFLMQKTSFIYEVLIHDDASTDCTAEIVTEYAKRYPNIIIPTIQTENQFSKGKKITANFLLPKAKGKYVALCEGDDYWTDPLKLQKQYDFLESNPNCSMCGHPVFQFHEENHTKVTSFPRSQPDQFSSIEELLHGNFLPTCSVLFKRRSLPLEKLHELSKGLVMGDSCIWALLVQQGTIGFIPSLMGAYRVHESGVWSGKTVLGREIEILKRLKSFRENFGDEFEEIILNAQLRQIRRISIEAIKSGDKETSFLFFRYYSVLRRKLVEKKWLVPDWKSAIALKLRVYIPLLFRLRKATLQFLKILLKK